MKQLTVFTAPKPFIDPHISLIQRNAIRSWLEMDDDVEVLLIGEEAGIADTASELGASCIPEVKKNDQGTPLVSSMFELARQQAQSNLLLFSNTDMLLFPDTLETVTAMSQQFTAFVLLGQRVDLDVNDPIDFSIGWDQRIRSRLPANGRLHPYGGSDYFIFPKSIFTQIPDFAIGRAGWDNWMIYHALTQGWLVVDATPTLTVVHQNHGYAHLDSDRGHQRHPETEKNLRLAGGMRRMYGILDVHNQLVNGEIRRAPWSLMRSLRSLERSLQPDEMVGSGPRWWLLRAVRKLRRALQKQEAA